MKMGPYLTPDTKLNLERVDNLNIKTKTTKLLGENRNKPLWSWVRQWLLAMTPRHKWKEKKLDKQEFIKFKTFVLWTASSRKREGTSQSGRKFFANHTSDKRVGSRIWKECLQPNNKKAKNTIEKWAKDLNRPFSKEDKHMAGAYRKRCSTSSAGKSKSKPQWDPTSHAPGWLDSQRQRTSAGRTRTSWGVTWCSPFGKQSHSSSKC